MKGKLFLHWSDVDIAMIRAENMTISRASFALFGLRGHGPIHFRHRL